MGSNQTDKQLTNADQASMWNGPQADSWIRFEDFYNNGLRAYSRHILQAAAIQNGERVLEIGCGSGELTRQMANNARGATVTGIDISLPLVELARKRVAESGLKNVNFICADAQVYPFPEREFDLAVSRFGVMFFEDARAAFSNIHRAVKPSGGLVMIVWQPLSENEWSKAMRKVVAHGRTLPELISGQPGPFGLSDEHYVRQVLESSGWKEVRLTSVHERYSFGIDQSTAFTFTTEQSSTASLLAELDEEKKARALDAVKASIAEHTSSEGVNYASAAWLIQAQS